ncbi:uncharacterized protein [Aphelocoma coerulescens]|uniref:uncharacterized protein isoform X3 n=1 Tax=Aphelocoma coerulescens TaxID=39617 RepID=UPI003604CAE5
MEEPLPVIACDRQGISSALLASKATEALKTLGRRYHGIQRQQPSDSRTFPGSESQPSFCTRDADGLNLWQSAPYRMQTDEICVRAPKTGRGGSRKKEVKLDSSSQGRWSEGVRFFYAEPSRRPPDRPGLPPS